MTSNAKENETQGVNWGEGDDRRLN